MNQSKNLNLFQLNFSMVLLILILFVVNVVTYKEYYQMKFYFTKKTILSYTSFMKKIEVMLNLVWLGKLISDYKKVQFLATSGNKIRELPQHLKYMQIAREKNWVYVPSKKGSNFDGLLWDETNQKVLKTIQFKMKEPGAVLGQPELNNWIKKYARLDLLEFGFQTPLDHYRNKCIIDLANKHQLNKERLSIDLEDYSSYYSQTVDKINLLDLLSRQASNNKIITKVNLETVDRFGEMILELAN